MASPPSAIAFGHTALAAFLPRFFILSEINGVAPVSNCFRAYRIGCLFATFLYPVRDQWRRPRQQLLSGIPHWLPFCHVSLSCPRSMASPPSAIAFGHTALAAFLPRFFRPLLLLPNGVLSCVGMAVEGVESAPLWT